MPYLYKEYRGQEARREATQKPPQGPGFSEKEICNIDRLEVWASSCGGVGRIVHGTYLCARATIE
jgi:hypothetical protein